MPDDKFDAIHTLDARGNVYLSVLEEHFKLSSNQVHRSIRGDFGHLLRLLASKGVVYQDLKSALIPKTDRHERAFLFDWQGFSGGLYGWTVMNCLLPALHRDASVSVRAGDWTSNLRPSAALRESEFDLDPPKLVHRVIELPDTLFVVYVNNLTPDMVNQINDAFATLPAYVGSVDMTFESFFKAMLSSMLSAMFIKHKTMVLTSQADDEPEHLDNPHLSYEFKENGYRVRAFPSLLYHLFLSYKIERPVIGTDSSDSKFSLNAITPEPHPLSECDVLLRADKLQYLHRAKHGSLKRTQLVDLDEIDIAARIKRKLLSNYIYSLAWSKQLNEMKFNIVLELVERQRIVCGLKYQPTDQRVEVITMF